MIDILEPLFLSFTNFVYFALITDDLMNLKVTCENDSGMIEVLELEYCYFTNFENYEVRKSLKTPCEKTRDEIDHSEPHSCYFTGFENDVAMDFSVDKKML